MAVLGRLLASVLPVALGRGHASWWVLETGFPRAAEQRAALWTTLAVVAALEAVALAGVMAGLGDTRESCIKFVGHPQYRGRVFLSRSRAFRVCGGS